MALQLGALRDALIDAGARPEMASQAAEELAVYEREIPALRSEMREEFAKVRGELNLLRWMIGANAGLTLAVFIKLFIH